MAGLLSVMVLVGLFFVWIYVSALSVRQRCRSLRSAWPGSPWFGFSKDRRSLPMDQLLVEFQDTAHLGRVVLRLLIAVVLGGIVGFERLRDGRAAGLRTHMLVSLGSALFTLTAVEGGMATADLSRIIQGVAAG